MPIILPKCTTGYKLIKDNCRCKKIVTKKKAPKKIKKTKTVKKKTGKKVVYTASYRLKQAKEMLDSDLLTQKEFDEIKNSIENEKCNTLKKKECKSKNKVCNPDTGRCKNSEVKKTKKKKKTAVNKTKKLKKKTKLTKKW